MHFYCGKTGEPRYEVPYADPSKGMRSATLTDAKKHGWVPSVTSVLGILDKPGLNNWKVDQAILAALTNPVIHDQMPHDQMMATIKRDAEEQSKAAMRRGTDIHAAIENALLGDPVAEWSDHVSGVIDCINKHADTDIDSGRWHVEHWIPAGKGYGGKCDLHNDEYLIDFKTKEFTSKDTVKGWPEQEVQLVAYDHGFGGPRRKLVNIFVSTTEPGLAVWYEWPQKGYDAALQKWFATLECWYAWKGYRPEQKP